MADPKDRTFVFGAALPTRRLAIEASAGTGKTFTLVDLAVRFIAEKDVSAAQLLMVTFTRAATSELRSRLRRRLVEVAENLGDVSQRDIDDELIAHLRQADGPLRLERVQRAVSEFDSATITTIHGFATQVLGTLGTTAGTDPDATLVDNSDELLADACADVLAEAAAIGTPAEELPKYASLQETTKQAMASSETDLVPVAGQSGATAVQQKLTQLVTQAISVMADRRRQASSLSYDDLLTQLRDALIGSGGDATVESIRERFKVALIDEFQDTDSVQWRIFSTLFGNDDADASLVLVGDPKQAIYFFRGADVHTYLTAVNSPSTELQVLRTNWRSDGAFIEAIDTLLEGVTFGSDDIAFERVMPAPSNADKRLVSATGGELPALAIRLAVGDALKRNDRRPKAIKADVARAAIYADLVAQVRELLDRARIPSREIEGEYRPVLPSNIAVLVRTKSEAADVQKALLAQGVPAVQARGSSVLNAPAADQWRLLVAALLRPSDSTRARAFALSWFVNWNAETLDRAGDEELVTLQEQLMAWVETLETHGVAPFVRQVITESGVVARVLERPDGDRDVTDLQHVGELLYASTPSQRVSVAGLEAVLDTEPVKEAEPDADGDLTARRIESEADAVQVMTVWVAKGLEFPIVCCPTMFTKSDGDVIYQDPQTRRRTFDLAEGKDWPNDAEAQDRKSRADAESLGEHLRLLYVALTRAKHHTIVWWTRVEGSEKSSLAHVLFARTDGMTDPEKFRQTDVEYLPPDKDTEDFLGPLEERSSGTITVETFDVTPSWTTRWVAREVDTSSAVLHLARLGSLPDRASQRWSFTSITHFADAADFDPFDNSLSDSSAGDEPVVPDSALSGGTDTPDDDSDPRQVPTMALLPAGRAFGTLVHAVLEKVDFGDVDLAGALQREVQRQLTRTPLDLTPAVAVAPAGATGTELLVEGLTSVLSSPLGGAFEDRTLRAVSLDDRMDEMSFELRLGDGGQRPSLRDIGRLLVDELPADDPFLAWAGEVASGAANISLAGHLTGSLDMVVRLRSDDGTPRFVVVDYKTNRLSQPRRPPGPDDYGSLRMAEAMAEHHYPLQALLYSVALHRYFRGRLSDYDPARHLGGAAYLFVRGMTGPDVLTDDGRPQGVFHWSIDPALVSALSDLLYGLTTSEAVA